MALCARCRSRTDSTYLEGRCVSVTPTTRLGQAVLRPPGPMDVPSLLQQEIFGRRCRALFAGPKVQLTWSDFPRGSVSFCSLVIGLMPPFPGAQLPFLMLLLVFIASLDRAFTKASAQTPPRCPVATGATACGARHLHVPMPTPMSTPMVTGVAVPRHIGRGVFGGTVQTRPRRKPPRE